MSENEPKNEQPEPTETEAPADGTEPAAAEGEIPPGETEPAAETAAPGDDAQAVPETDGEAEEEAEVEADPQERIEILEAKVSDLNDKLLRAMAETENVRRRAQRDREDAAKYSLKSFVEQMLTVADNMGRALHSIDPEARTQDPALENIAVGVEMVNRELLSSLERFGIKPIEALGHRFDPMRHEAMFEIEDKETAAGTVAQVLEVGYMLHDRTLRAAKVGVTKGGPKEIPGEDKGDEDAAVEAQVREGQAAYEQKGGEAGSTLDEEL